MTASALRVCTALPAVAAALFLSACVSQSPIPPVDAPPGSDLPKLESENAPEPAADPLRLMGHIDRLSSDDFEGRFPASRGEELTVAYLVQQFTAMGLSPGNPDGTFVQSVPLVGIDGKPELTFKVRGRTVPMTYRKDYVATTPHFDREVTVKDSPLVFVGYGVQAPEYRWDDYKGVSVKGKTIVMLINDPAVPDPADPSKLDDAMFKGKAMTYYGRWTYKYEIASKLGAAAAIIVHETVPAAYPWSVVESSWTGEQMDLANPDRNHGRVPVTGWITVEQAHALFKAGGRDFDQLEAAARTRDFKPVALHGTMTARIRNQVREVKSRNVVAAVPGSDPALKDQWIVYNAHWDHLGVDPTIQGDQIFNGAVDNASGIAGLLEIARVFHDGPAPGRSVLFIAATSEEQGLLGSQFYAENPLYPIARTVAMFNMDSLNVWGPAKDIQVIGMGQSTMEDDLVRIASARERVVVPDKEPEKGSYFRSDQFNFAKMGVPALYCDGGQDVIGKPGFGKEMADAYTAHDYHQPSDQIKPGWDLRGAALDMQLLHDVGLAIADRAEPPEWKDGSEFKALR